MFSHTQLFTCWYKIMLKYRFSSIINLITYSI